MSEFMLRLTDEQDKAIENELRVNPNVKSRAEVVRLALNEYFNIIDKQCLNCKHFMEKYHSGTSIYNNEYGICMFDNITKYPHKHNKDSCDKFEKEK